MGLITLIMDYTLVAQNKVYKDVKKNSEYKYDA